MWELRKFRRIRRRTDYIIIVPSLMLKENFFIDPIVIDSGKLYTWGIWEKYFLKELRKDALPCHYFVEQIGEDYTCIKGLPDFQPSYFIEDLVSVGVVDRKYLNSIIVVVGENYNRQTLSERCSEQVASKVICPLLRDFQLHPERVMFIDECLREDYQESMQYSNLEYDIETSKFFDMTIMRQAIFKYKNY